jgi:hypothetical protein
MKTALVFLVLLLGMPLAASELPEAPTPNMDGVYLTRLAPRPQKEPRKNLNRIDWYLLASDAGIRTLDFYSTRAALHRGNHEKFLPGFVVNHTASLAAFEGGMVALDYFAARKLIRHHHPRIARIVLLADFVQVAPWAIHNLTLPDCRH